MCQLASAASSLPALPLDEGSDGGDRGRLMMMRGMTAKNFDPVRYSGRWFEVASLKRGFAGQGQEDCHCTQVIAKGYVLDLSILTIDADTISSRNLDMCTSLQKFSKEHKLIGSGQTMA